MKKPYPTKTTVVGDVTVEYPSTSITNERASYLEKLFNKHVHPLKEGDHWKSECFAEVPVAIADDVADAMSFMGAIVDDRRDLPGNRIRLYSRGYWAHGF